MFGACALASPLANAKVARIVNRQLTVRARVICIAEYLYDAYKFLFIRFFRTLDYLPDIDREYNMSIVATAAPL